MQAIMFVQVISMAYMGRKVRERGKCVPQVSNQEWETDLAKQVPYQHLFNEYLRFIITS